MSYHAESPGLQLYLTSPQKSTKLYTPVVTTYTLKYATSSSTVWRLRPSMRESAAYCSPNAPRTWGEGEREREPEEEESSASSAPAPEARARARQGERTSRSTPPHESRARAAPAVSGRQHATSSSIGTLTSPTLSCAHATPTVSMSSRPTW